MCNSINVIMPDAHAVTDPAASPGAEPGNPAPQCQAGMSPRAKPGTGLAGGIGRWLTAYRERRGLRVTQLAREIGVSPSLISQIERGQARPSVSTLFAMAQALGVPVDAFFRVQAHEGSPGAEQEYHARTAQAEPSGQEDAAGDGGRAADPPRDALRGRLGADGRARDAPGPVHAPGAGTEDRYVVRRGNRAAIDIEGGIRWERLTPRTLPHLDFLELVYGPHAESNPALYTHPGTEMVIVMSGVLDITVGFERYRLQPGDSMHLPSSMPHRYANPTGEVTRAVTVILYDCPAPAGPACPPVR